MFLNDNKLTSLLPDTFSGRGGLVELIALHLQNNPWTAPLDPALFTGLRLADLRV
jgi:hypothetical protein